MDAQEFAKETAVAFTENQCALRSGNSVDPVCPGLLQRISENNGLNPVIMRRNKIEIHSQLRTSNKMSGVNRTRSASAVRSSRETGAKYRAPNSRPLVARHNAMGQNITLNTTRRAHPMSKMRKTARTNIFTSDQTV